MGVETLLKPPEAFERDRTKSSRDKYLRGQESEEKVYQALLILPDIKEIIRSNPFSKEDVEGVDMIVFFKGEHMISSVNVQVKSSESGVREFHKHTVQKLRRSEEALTFRGKLLLDRMVILDTSRGGPRSIRRSFGRQVRDIGAYHLGRLQAKANLPY